RAFATGRASALPSRRTWAGQIDTRRQVLEKCDRDSDGFTYQASRRCSEHGLQLFIGFGQRRTLVNATTLTVAVETFELSACNRDLLPRPPISATPCGRPST